MKGRWGMLIVSAVLCGSAVVSSGARIRPNGDPTTDRVIWADPFDNYTQWAYDNGQIWQGGPTPPGSASGTYPEKGTCQGQQVNPSLNQMARDTWPRTMNCGVITRPTEGGQSSDPGIFEANKDPLCGQTGEIAPLQSMFATLNYCWFQGGSRSSMTMFDHNMAGRIQQIATARGLGTKNTVNGTDAKPLVLTFYIIDLSGGAYRNWVNNVYVELNLAGDHAPTDYIWRGDPDPNHWQDPEYCPQGPYPIICQQVREVNGGVSEDAADLTYLNAHCPPLVPAFNESTGQGKTWSSIAFGLLAIMDKDPCGVAEQGVDSHKPNMDHYVVFDGNKWREIRNSRFAGLNGLPQAGGVDLPWVPVAPNTGPNGYDSSMALGTAGSCNNFSNGGGGMTVVYMKIISDYILLYVDNNFYHAGKTNPPWHAAVPRVYKGAFDTISVGVGPGCELDSATYACKAGGTPYQCLTYSTNFEAYWRSQLDAMSLYGGDLGIDVVPGACCKPNGTCSVVTSAVCAEAPAGVYHGNGSTCAQYKCCPTPFADANHDGDVDGDDFGAFQLCYTGDVGNASAACTCFDRNDDTKVDGTDLTRFKNCWTGPNVTWDSILTPACIP